MMAAADFLYYARIGLQMQKADDAYAEGDRPDAACKSQTGPVLTPAECALLMASLGKHQARGGLVTSPTGAAVIDLARYSASETLFDPRAPEFAWLIDRLGPFIADAAVKFGLPGLRLVEAARLVRYGRGGHFNWHPDSSDQVQRRLTLSLQLSPEASYSGGDLMMLGGRDEWACADRTQGGACLFPAALFHRATQVTKGQRSALVLWFY
ncbi:MAG: 2OG-Fe(II) oxygenase [Pseudomonadota bacterium]